MARGLRIRHLDTDVRVQQGRGSYMPALMKIVNMTKGPIFELGCGYVSTPYLYWTCFLTKRKLVSFENHPEWYGFASRFACDFHTIHFVEDWDKIDLSGECSVGFIDHAPNQRRRIDVPRLAHAEYLVVHDTENSSQRQYGFARALRQYKYHFKYGGAHGPSTSVLSNFHDLTNFTVQG
jgi:hypothetical protein